MLLHALNRRPERRLSNWEGAGIEAASQNDTSHRNFLAVWLSTNSLTVQGGSRFR
jgi:hypothetical protein